MRGDKQEKENKTQNGAGKNKSEIERKGERKT